MNNNQSNANEDNLCTFIACRLAALVDREVAVAIVITTTSASLQLAEQLKHRAEKMFIVEIKASLQPAEPKY